MANIEKSVIDLPWDTKILKDTPQEMIIAGYAYTQDFVDAHDEFMRKSTLGSAAKAFLNRPNRKNIMLFHMSSQIGEILDTYEHEGKTLMTGMDEQGLFVIARLFGDLSISPHIFQAIKENRINSFSIGGFKKTIPSSLNGRSAKEIIHYDLHEISIVPQGAHPLAKFRALKSFCECGEACMVEFSQKQVQDAILTYFPQYMQIFIPSEQKYYIRALPDRKDDVNISDDSIKNVNITNNQSDMYKSSQNINKPREDMTETIKVDTQATTTNPTNANPQTPAPAPTNAQTPAPAVTAPTPEVKPAETTVAPAVETPAVAPAPAPVTPAAAPAPDVSADIKGLTDLVKGLITKVDTIAASNEASAKAFGENVTKVIEAYVAKDKGASTGQKATVQEPGTPGPNDAPLISSLKSHGDIQKILDKAGIRQYIR